MISAGNHARDIYISSVPKQDFNLLRNNLSLLRQETCKALNNDARHRRLLSPAESINALTIGAIHYDESKSNSLAGYVLDPLPLNSCALPSPINAQGSGFRRSIKPEIMFPGGRQLYMDKIHNGSNVVLEILHTNLAPGQKVAFPSMGDPTATGYTRGTSNATALAARSAAILYNNLHEMINETEKVITDEHISVMIKALLVHSASWGDMANNFDQYLNLRVDNRKNVLSRFLGYGKTDTERVMFCTEQRATLLGWGNISDGAAHRYNIPLPSSLGGKKVWRKMVITLAWFTPVNTAHQAYRRASLWFDPYGEDSSNNNLASTLGISRCEVDWRSARRGTVQHEIFEGEDIKVFEQEAVSEIQINCRADAGDLNEEIPYALVVTLEVSPGIELPIYEEISTRIRPRIQPRPIV